MTLNVILFGVAAEIFGDTRIEVKYSQPEKFQVSDLKSLLENDKPALKDLGSYMIAVNNEYAEPGYAINENDEIAVIPPVSGG